MDKPFVTVKKAGQVRLKGNHTGGKRLADIDEVTGSLDVVGNSGCSSEKNQTDDPRWWSIAFRHPVISGIIVSVVAGIVLAYLGVAGKAPFS